MTAREARPVVTVSELNHYVARSLRADSVLGDLRLRGEVSGIVFRPAAWYFELKDDHARVSCVMFRQAVSRASFRPADGDQVILQGYAALYEEGGRFQFVANAIRPDGAGSIWLQFEQLKKRLAAEGLFDADRKRPLPERPRKIAVVTSESGAVWHDIHKIAAARDPGVPLVLVPVSVQGAGAGAEIAAGVRLAGMLPGVDLIITGRGGGSMEDLWCFNEEQVARAIAESPVPVISAVGHETDFTIADFAADRRASTPSNAAELALRDRREVLAALSALRDRMGHAAEQAMNRKRTSILEMRRSLDACSPERRVYEFRQALSAARASLDMAADLVLRDEMNRVGMNRLRLEQAADVALTRIRHRLDSARVSLEALSPGRVLERGYALVMDGDRTVVHAKDAPERMTLRFADGSVKVRREEDGGNG